MNSKERVRRAIRFEKPDRVPHYLPDGKENDLEWLWITRPEPIKPWTNIGDNDEMIDCWGTVFRRVADGVIGRGEVYKPVLPDISKQAEYELPDMLKPEYCDEIRQAVIDNNKADNPKYILVPAACGSLNEGTHNLMGLENMFYAYYEDPDDLKTFIARLAEKQRESIRMLAEIGVDGVMFYDDWGLQDRLMVSTDQIEEFFMPHYRASWALAHELGMDVWMHSCGQIMDALDGFIDAGLNVIQQDQQENMGVDNLNERFGGRLAFWCPVDIQRTMINGSLDEIRAYATNLIQTLGDHDGGFVSMAYSSPAEVHHTPEKLAAMSEAFRAAENQYS